MILNYVEEVRDRGALGGGHDHEDHDHDHDHGHGHDHGRRSPCRDRGHNLQRDRGKCLLCLVPNETNGREDQMVVAGRSWAIDQS